MTNRLPVDFPRTRGAYVRMTGAVRDLADSLPGGVKAFSAPTYLCAVLYVASVAALLLRRDARVVRALLVPAACFLVATVLRPMIGRTRPYDRFDAPPVGRYKRGKGRSMPSRHAASAAAIACAVIYAFPGTLSCVCMVALSVLIAALRVLTGQHYLNDAICAIAMSFILSLIGYTI